MTPSDTDIAWLAGLLEGEGYFARGEHKPPRRPQVVLSLQMTDEDVVLRAQMIAGLLNRTTFKRPDHRSDRFSDMYGWSVHGDEAMRIMRLVRPYMGQRRGAKIDAILSAPPGTYSHQPRPKEAS